VINGSASITSSIKKRPVFRALFFADISARRICLRRLIGYNESNFAKGKLFMTAADAQSITNQQFVSANPPGGISPAARWERWQQRLLDLSLRNRLLNTRDSQQMIPLAGADLALLEDALSDKDDFALFPLEEILTPAEAKILAQAAYQIPDIPEPAPASALNEPAPELSPVEGNSPSATPALSAAAAPTLAGVAAKLRAEQAARHLCVPLSAAELLKRQTAIYRQSRTDLEEGGVNTLFLALGFLRWEDAPGKSHRGPHVQLDSSRNLYHSPNRKDHKTIRACPGN